MHSVCSLVPRPQLQLSLLAVRIMLSVIHTASNDSCSEGLGTRLLGMCHLNSVRREATLSVFSPTLSLCAKCSGRLATVSADISLLGPSACYGFNFTSAGQVIKYAYMYMLPH